MNNGTALLLYFHLKILKNKAVLKSVTGQFLTGLSGLPAVELPGAICQNVMVPGKPYTPVFENGLKMVSLITSSVF
jgi:hypothetical protein